MELYESDDKNQLLKKSKLQRGALKEEVRLISARTQKMLTNALIIGGSFAVTYLVIRQFGSSKTKDKRRSKKTRYVAQPTIEPVAIHKPQAPGIVSQLGATLVSQATVFLLDIAKGKLSEFLQTQSKKNDQV